PLRVERRETAAGGHGVRRRWRPPTARWWWSSSTRARSSGPCPGWTHPPGRVLLIERAGQPGQRAGDLFRGEAEHRALVVVHLRSEGREQDVDQRVGRGRAGGGQERADVGAPEAVHAGLEAGS